MTGPEHYTKAEDHLTDAASLGGEEEEASAWHQRQAQVHATLALAAATGLNDTESGMPPGDWAAWRDAAGVTS
jgi:hypothetical protein